ncbi:TetR/AcrR family transcriptional regulator [Endozoicomonas sp. 8E]|uniref:TetR/AcrR family transcriptional regulator n=1 Tax=Endozoicomonas sp. 8E TaxID=3035692 RepID=UPI0029391F25|nr:TetR/AcrR family transcriptional regulator [Endozoicomonas sp. 8E]WOG25332.1 TetR/AcrR family transcriptional regulator [Endozoicomonas sp. 8E]
MAQLSTVERILDSAELLFAEHGFSETSLRTITKQAGVNLAAVNYHFGSKKALIQAVFTRFLDPFMKGLDTTLDEWSDQSGPPDLEAVLEILVDHILAVKPRRPDDISIFMKLMGLAFTQNQGHLKRYLTETYGTVFSRYFELLFKACPDLPIADKFWRTYFSLGSAVFSVSGAGALLSIAERDYDIDDNLENIMRRMVPFMAAGLRAHATYDNGR